MEKGPRQFGGGLFLRTDDLDQSNLVQIKRRIFSAHSFLQISRSGIYESA